MDSVCGKCRWHIYEKDWICNNPDSEYDQDFTPYTFTCEEFEEKE